MKAIQTYIFLLFTIMFISCEQEIEVGDISVSKSVVVNSTISPLKLFEVDLTFSRNILDYEDSIEPITDAKVNVYSEDDGWLFELEHVADGHYSYHNLYPIENKVYKIEVLVDGYSPITASTKIPSKASVTNIKTEEVDIDGLSALKVDFDIEDSEDTDNYYIWEIVKGEIDINNGITTPIIFIDQNYQYSVFDGSYDFNGSKLYRNDSNIVGAIINNSFISFVENNSGTNPDIPTQTQKSYLKLTSASSDYYNYYLSVDQFLQQKANGSNIVPVKIHSNIRGGLGIFAGYNEQYEPL